MNISMAKVRNCWLLLLISGQQYHNEQSSAFRLANAKSVGDREKGLSTLSPTFWTWTFGFIFFEVDLENTVSTFNIQENFRKKSDPLSNLLLKLKRNRDIMKTKERRWFYQTLLFYSSFYENCMWHRDRECLEPWEGSLMGKWEAKQYGT